MILIVDNGGQYVHRIYRSLRYLGVPSKIVANSISPEDIGEDVKGIIIGGGPDIER
ncbi:MAG TPA: GMP synthase, partial [Methanococcaceae archaeon]|nr:GMP synthase [Methanococcaceae archaeon]